MSRFFSFFVKDENFIVEGDDFHHLYKVLRLKEGEEVRLLNGKGKVFFGRIKKIEKSKAFVSVEKEYFFERKKPFLNFFVSLVPKDKRAVIVQKLTELGAFSIFFFPSEFSKVNIKGELSKKEEKLRKIAVGAIKQSGNPYLPNIRILRSFKELFDYEGDNFLLSQNGSFLIKLNMDEKEKVNIFIGPEGGFSKRELEGFRRRNFEEIKISENVLRTETAVISSAAIFSYLKEIECF